MDRLVCSSESVDNALLQDDGLLVSATRDAIAGAAELVLRNGWTEFLDKVQGFKLGSASGHVRRTLVPSHEGHIKIPLGSTLTECRQLT